MSLGPGPFIPMRHHERQESDEIPTAHFYDDIDNIRKIAQERALMIKRLQEEEAAVWDLLLVKHCVGRLPGDQLMPLEEKRMMAVGEE